MLVSVQQTEVSQSVSRSVSQVAAAAAVLHVAGVDVDATT